MKINRFVISLCCLLCASGVLSSAQETTPTIVPPAAVQNSSATFPRLVSFSGTIVNAGKPVTGRIPVIFSLYPEQEGGTPVWSETQVVQTDAQGHYTVLLGATEPSGLPLDAFTSGTARWLEIGRAHV